MTRDIRVVLEISTLIVKLELETALAWVRQPSMIHHTNPLDLPQTLSTVVVFVYEVLYCHEYTTVELRRHTLTARKTIRPLQLGVCLAKARNSTPESGVLGFSRGDRTPFQDSM